MGQTLDHALGRSRKCFAKQEVTFGTQILPVATDAFKTTKPIKFNAKIDRRNRMDNRNTRDYLERITGVTTVGWDCEAYVLPSGTAGTVPNIGKFLTNGFGKETIVGATSVTYATTNLQAMGSLTLTQNMNNVVQETAAGAWVESIGLKVSGKDEPKITLSGGAAKYALTGTTTSAGIVAGSATTMTFTDPAAMQLGSVFVVNTDAGTGYTVTIYNATTGAATFTPAAVTGWANLATITPAVPTETTVGSPLSFTLGSMTLDGVAIPVIDFDCSVKNNIKPIGIDEAFNTNATDYIPNDRDVKGSFNLRGKKDQILNWGKRWNLTTRALVLVLGSVAGKKLTINIPTAEIEFSPVNIPDVDEITMPFPFTALGNAGEDAMNWVFT